ncbi:hypothetical protein ACTXT7_014175 [Hymenolepis weldensis]
MKYSVDLLKDKLEDATASNQYNQSVCYACLRICPVFEMDANQVVGILFRCYFYQAEMAVTSPYVTKLITLLVLANRPDNFRRFDGRKVHIIELMTENKESRYLALFLLTTRLGTRRSPRIKPVTSGITDVHIHHYTGGAKFDNPICSLLLFSSRSNTIDI